MRHPASRAMSKPATSMPRRPRPARSRPSPSRRATPSSVGDLLFRLKQDQQLVVLAGANAAGRGGARQSRQPVDRRPRGRDRRCPRQPRQGRGRPEPCPRQLGAQRQAVCRGPDHRRRRYDQDRSTLASAEALVRQLSAQLRVAELPARDRPARRGRSQSGCCRSRCREGQLGPCRPQRHLPRRRAASSASSTIRARWSRRARR